MFRIDKCSVYTGQINKDSVHTTLIKVELHRFLFYSEFGLDRFLFYSEFGLSRFLFYSEFSLDRFLFYSGFCLDRFLFYSGFCLDRFHGIVICTLYDQVG